MRTKVSYKNFSPETLVRSFLKHYEPYNPSRSKFKSFKFKPIFLDANENPYGNGFNRYPDPDQYELRKLLALKKRIHSHQIFFGNGSNQVLDLIIRTFCNPGKDKIIALSPTYGMYKSLAAINDVTYCESPYRKDGQPDVEALLCACDYTTKIIFLCSPNNPTGTVIKKSIIREILDRFHGLVVVDEAYIDFTPQQSTLGLLDQYPNLIVVQTLSKAYATAAIRLGIGYGSLEVVKYISKMIYPYAISQVTQDFACKALHKERLVQAQIKEINIEKERLIAFFKEVKFINHIYPSSANFILIKVDNVNKRYSELLEFGVVVRIPKIAGDTYQNVIRITVGTPEENKQLKEIFLEIEKKYLNEKESIIY